MTRSPGRLICRTLEAVEACIPDPLHHLGIPRLGHPWAYLIDHGNASRLCIRCGEAGWPR